MLLTMYMTGLQQEFRLCVLRVQVLIGIDELGVQIEEPSSILPLVPMMNKIRFEVQAVMREEQHPLHYAA